LKGSTSYDSIYYGFNKHVEMAKPSACILDNDEKTCENGYSGFFMETAYWKIRKASWYLCMLLQKFSYFGKLCGYTFGK